MTINNANIICDNGARRNIRNNFAYASQVWSPQTIQLIENIENIKKATKYILNLGFITNVSHTSRLLQLNLLP